MLFRDKNGKIIEILKYDFINDINYYTNIYNNIYNTNNIKSYNLKDNIEINLMDNIIKLIKK